MLLVKMKLLGLALIQCDRCASKKRKKRHRGAGRPWEITAVHRGMPRVAGKHPAAGKDDEGVSSTGFQMETGVAQLIP